MSSGCQMLSELSTNHPRCPENHYVHAIFYLQNRYRPVF
jgi:hypothetical protein